MRVAMVGQKGIPAVWGGVEVYVTELARALAARGHDVTVFGRPYYQREVRAAGLETPPGVTLRVLPTIRTKHLDALVHCLLATLDVAAPWAAGFDVIHFHAIGPGALVPLIRIAAPRCAAVLTVHALDWRRDKWSRAARWLLRAGEGVGVRLATRVIAVSQAIAAYLARRYGVHADVIPGGVSAPRWLRPGACLRALGLQPRRYVLFMGRLVPEKGAHTAIEAFRRLAGDWKLVVAGPAQQADYAAGLARDARLDPRIVLPGAVSGDVRAELLSCAGAFVLPSTIEGFPLALLEALAYGLPVAASHLESVREVAALAGHQGLFLAPPGDAEALHGALVRALALTAAVPSGADDRPPVARETARWGWSEAARRTEEVYRAARRRPAAPAGDGAPHRGEQAEP